MIVSLRQRFIFIHIPKTGGSTVTHHLRQLIDPASSSDADPWRDDWQSAYHFDGIQHSGYRENADLVDQNRDFFSFAFVRNPWDRALSWYLSTSRDASQTVSPDGFSAFLNERFVRQTGLHVEAITRPQYAYIADANGRIAVGHVARFEDFADEFARIGRRIGLSLGRRPILALNVANTERVPYRDFYDERSREVVAAAHAEDIERFGYRF